MNSEILLPKPFSIEFQEKTTIYPQNYHGIYEEEELYFPVGMKTKDEILRRKTGRTFRWKCGPSLEEEVLPQKTENDVVIYDPRNFLPFLIELHEDLRVK